MVGPAAKSWESLNLPIINYSNLDLAITGSEVLLSGTGWASDVEHLSRKIAKEARIFSIAVLDHWVNYQDRFLRENEIILPDELIVTDEYAMLEARRCFPNLPIKVYENLYLKNQLLKISPSATENEVLYLLEPIRNWWSSKKAGEFEALDFFISHWDTIGIPENTLMRLRPHPSDPPGKYDEWISIHKYMNVLLDDSPNLATALSRAYWVAGCETYAMTIALAAGRIVISTLPKWAKSCRLPQEGILHLANLL